MGKKLLDLAPFLFFGVLLLVRAARPDILVFDEVHYIPAAKALMSGTDNLNWVHPPLAKLIMGLGWLVFTKWFGLMGEPTVFRVVAIFFGLWALWAVRGWMLALGFSRYLAQIAVWLTGFNFLWFVQSKTGMLDIFFLALGLWGTLEVYRKRYWRGWVWLGLAMACKWSAAPFVLIALVLSRQELPARVAGGVVALMAYAATFIPLAFLDANAVSPLGLIAYHQRMFKGFDSIAAAPHPYASQWWKWPTLIRPMWYTFESSGGREFYVWAGGNPVLYWVALPLLMVVVWFALFRRDKTARVLALLYWVPLLFWAVAPRKLQMYYYYLPPSMLLGPIVVWAHEHVYSRRLVPGVRQTRGWMLFGFTLLCGILFLYFLPLMDARPLSPGRYHNYMWLRSWI